MAGQQLSQDAAGNIWDTSVSPPRFVRGPQQASPQVVVPAAPKDPPEPKFVPDHPNLVYTPGKGVTALPGVPDKPQSPTFIPGKDGYVLKPDGTAAPITGLPGAGVQLDAAQRAKAIQQFNYAKQLQDTADQLNQLYMKGPGATSGLEGVKDYFPSPDNKNFDTAANKSRGIVGQTLGFTGGQLNTPQEAEKAVGPFIPEASDYDKTIVQKIQSMRDLADAQSKEAIQTLGGIPDANGVIHPVPAQQPPVAAAPTPPDQQALATGKTRDQIDPVLRAVGQRAGAMVSAGVPDAEILKFLSDSGVNPANTNMDQVFKFRRSKDFTDWQRRHPGQAYPLGPQFYTKQVPMTDARSLFNKTAATGVGGALLAAPVASANAISGGRLDNLASDPEAAQTGMDLLRGQHPLASFAGDVAGQASLEAAAGLIPGAQGLMATRMGRRGADALYGYYSGSGEGDGSVTDGLEGAVTNLGGGMFGRSLMRGTGRTLTGVKNAGLQYLDNLGVPLTIGQIGRGSKNVVGRTVGGIEERLRGLYGFDAVIGAGRQRGDKGFNEAAFRQAGGSGATGAAGLDELNGLRKQAYGFLDNTNLPIDAQFAGSQAGVRAAISGMPAFGNEVGKGLDQIDRVSGNALINGRDWQSALSDTKANRASIAGAPFANDATKALKDVEGNLLNLADRQGPAGTIDNLNAANKLHAQVETLAGALDNAPVQRAGQLFDANRLDSVSRVNGRNFGGRMASLTGRNRPFYDLTQAGLESMPSLTPDSGTAGRMLLVPLMTGGVGAGLGAATGGDDRAGGAERGTDYGLALGLAAAGPYSKTGQKIIQKALLGDRPRALNAIGNYLIAHPRLGGMFGAGAGRDLFFQPELYQN